VANMESARPAAAIAVNLHNLDMLSLLMSHAKMQLYINDINAAGFGLANVIIYYNNIPAMEIFVKNKYVRPNLLNIYGDTTYMAAAEANRLEILALLMKHTWPCPTVLDQVCDQLVEHGLTSNNKANYNRRLCNLIQALPINPQLNILKNLQKSCRSFYKSSGFSLRWLFNIFGRVDFFNEISNLFQDYFVENLESILKYGCDEYHANSKDTTVMDMITSQIFLCANNQDRSYRMIAIIKELSLSHQEIIKDFIQQKDFIEILKQGPNMSTNLHNFITVIASEAHSPSLYGQVINQNKTLLYSKPQDSKNGNVFLENNREHIEIQSGTPRPAL